MATGEEVKFARKALGMTQIQFGKWLYVSGRQVRNWESGSVKMPELAWEKVSGALAERQDCSRTVLD